MNHDHAAADQRAARMDERRRADRSTAAILFASFAHLPLAWVLLFLYASWVFELGTGPQAPGDGASLDGHLICFGWACAALAIGLPKAGFGLAHGWALQRDRPRRARQHARVFAGLQLAAAACWTIGFGWSAVVAPTGLGERAILFGVPAAASVVLARFVHGAPARAREVSDGA